MDSVSPIIIALTHPCFYFLLFPLSLFVSSVFFPRFFSFISFPIFWLVNYIEINHRCPSNIHVDLTLNKRVISHTFYGPYTINKKISVYRKFLNRKVNREFWQKLMVTGKNNFSGKDQWFRFLDHLSDKGTLYSRLVAFCKRGRSGASWGHTYWVISVLGTGLRGEGRPLSFETFLFW